MTKDEDDSLLHDRIHKHGRLLSAKPVGHKPPKALDAISDVVLAYRPKPKSKPARKRKRRATRVAKEKALVS